MKKKKRFNFAQISLANFALLILHGESTDGHVRGFTGFGKIYGNKERARRAGDLILSSA